MLNDAHLDHRDRRAARRPTTVRSTAGRDCAPRRAASNRRPGLSRSWNSSRSAARRSRWRDRRRAGDPAVQLVRAPPGDAEAGFVDRDRQTRKYLPSIRSVFLGNWIHDTLFQRGSFLRALDTLSDATGANVRLGVRNGIHVRYAHISWPGGHPDLTHLRPGMLIPICQDALGRMLLVGAGEREARGIVRHANADAATRRLAASMSRTSWRRCADVPRQRLRRVPRLRDARRMRSCRAASGSLRRPRRNRPRRGGGAAGERAREASRGLAGHRRSLVAAGHSAPSRRSLRLTEPRSGSRSCM